MAAADWTDDTEAAVTALLLLGRAARTYAGSNNAGSGALQDQTAALVRDMPDAVVTNVLTAKADLVVRQFIGLSFLPEELVTAAFRTYTESIGHREAANS